MVFIDKQGRLFSKINIIDFLVLIFLICLIPMLFFGYKVHEKNKVAKAVIRLEKQGVHYELDNGKKYLLIICTFTIDNLLPEMLKKISVGDREIDSHGEMIGEILSLGKPEPVIRSIDIGGGKKITTEDLILKKITATLKLRAIHQHGNLYYKNKQIVDGASINFRTDKYSIEATYNPAKVSVSLEKDRIISTSELTEMARKLVEFQHRINQQDIKIENLEYLRQRLEDLNKRLSGLSEKLTAVVEKESR